LKERPKCGSYGFCHACCEYYTGQAVRGSAPNSFCGCERPGFSRDKYLLNEDGTRKKFKLKTACRHCGSHDHSANRCTKRCKQCDDFHKTGEGSRCLIAKIKKPQYYWTPEQPLNEDGSPRPMLWAYDIETMMVDDPEFSDMLFEEDMDEKLPDGRSNPNYGKFKMTRDGDRAVCRTRVIKRQVHQFCLLICKNVFDPNGRLLRFTSLDDFFTTMKTVTTTNGAGKVVPQPHLFFAHNAAGYDNRIIENYIVMKKAMPCKPINAGNKIVQFMFNKDQFVFRDTMKFLPGSLASLAKEMLPKPTPENPNVLRMVKGYFPHLFNTPDHQNYVGMIPDKKYFSIGFIKSESELRDFTSWHAEQVAKGPVWNFREELLKYCDNDVEILAALMKITHDRLVDLVGFSPFGNTTIPGFVHEVICDSIAKEIALPEDADDRHQIIRSMGRKTWVTLLNEEHQFVRAALRGGRTECRRTFLEIEPDSPDRIVYIDVTSMYPYVQLTRKFPVGYPTILVYDPKHYPCNIHSNPSKNNSKDPNNPIMTCSCRIERKRQSRFKALDIVEKIGQSPPAEEFLDDDSYFGYVCVTIEVPENSFVPFVVHYDRERNKCMASNGIHKELHMFTEELKCYMRYGLIVREFHRFDRYASTEGLWNPIMKKLYITKMKTSGPKPPQTQWAGFVEHYKKLGMHREVVDALRQNDWGKNSASKKVAKIFLNSGWGKHCQRLHLPQIEMHSWNERDRIDETLEKNRLGLIKTEALQRGPTGLTTHKFVDMETERNLHKLYIPAGAAVPAYGRMMFMEKVMQLPDPERQLLYHDTDSMIYLQQAGDPDLVEGDELGQWAEEDFSKKRIIGFVGLGPKSYALKMADGTTEVKIKGVSVKQGHSHIVNYENMKKLVLDKSLSLDVPQFTFEGSTSVYTRHMHKIVQFNEGELKGILRPSGNGMGETLYPIVNQ